MHARPGSVVGWRASSASCPARKDAEAHDLSDARPAPDPRETLRPAAPGFTLLELAVVLMILGVLLAIALPRLPRLARADLESSGDRLAATMQYLADEATLRGRTYRMRLDLDAEEWTVDALAPWSVGSDGQPRTFQRVADDDMARRTRMPPGIDLAAVTDARGEQATGQRDVFFLPEGIPEGLAVRLGEAEGGASTEVLLDAARSTARRGDVREQPQ